MNDPAKYCPFRKAVKVQLGAKTFQKSYKEFFMGCDEENCMAYKNGECLRLKDKLDQVHR